MMVYEIRSLNQEPQNKYVLVYFGGFFIGFLPETLLRSGGAFFKMLLRVIRDESGPFRVELTFYC